MSMITREIAPAVPARKVRREMVKPRVSTLKQPNAVSMAVGPQLPLGSIARTGLLIDKNPAAAKAKAVKYVRMEVCFLPGKKFFIN